MKEKLPKILLVIILILVLGNLGYLDYLILKKNKEEISLRPADLAGEALEEQTDLKTELQQYIDQKIAEGLAKIPTQKPEKTTYIIPTTAPGTQAKVFYIPLITDATINSLDWKDITPSDFYFDLADYLGVKNVRFEAYLKSKHQAGTVYVRLYDATNKRAVDYSDLSSNSETYKLERSSDLVIWRGSNLYRLQGKTSTDIEGYLKDAKLKITF